MKILSLVLLLCVAQSLFATEERPLLDAQIQQALLQKSTKESTTAVPVPEDPVISKKTLLEGAVLGLGAIAAYNNLVAPRVSGWSEHPLWQALTYSPPPIEETKAKLNQIKLIKRWAPLINFIRGAGFVEL